MLRLRSYLAPSIPYEFFRTIAGELSRRLGIAVDLTFETRTSGPIEGEPDPLSRGEVDVAFLCAPTYGWLARAGIARLVAAPVPADPRAARRPVYFSDVVVARGCTATTIDELRAARWALNDPASLSGYGCVVDAIGAPNRAIVSGSHLASLELVRSGAADAAAIDSNLLYVQPLDEELRVVASLGPHPIQPVVARSDLDPRLHDELRDALLRVRLADSVFVGFTAVEHADYVRPRAA